jgi:hypothetical protein
VIPQLPTGTRISAPSYPQAIASRPTNNSQVITHRSSPACGRTERQPNQLEPSQAVPNANELQQILDKLNAVKDTGRSESLLDLVCNKDDILDLPVYGDPPGTQKGNLKVDLLKHQLQALQWCIEKETPVLPTNETERPVQFWQFKKNPVSGKVRGCRSWRRGRKSNPYFSPSTLTVSQTLVPHPLRTHPTSKWLLGALKSLPQF